MMRVVAYQIQIVQIRPMDIVLERANVIREECGLGTFQSAQSQQVYHYRIVVQFLIALINPIVHYVHLHTDVFAQMDTHLVQKMENVVQKTQCNFRLTAMTWTVVKITQMEYVPKKNVIVKLDMNGKIQKAYVVLIIPDNISALAQLNAGIHQQGQCATETAPVLLITSIILQIIFVFRIMMVLNPAPIFQRALINHRKPCAMGRVLVRPIISIQVQVILALDLTMGTGIAIVSPSAMTVTQIELLVKVENAPAKIIANMTQHLTNVWHPTMELWPAPTFQNVWIRVSILQNVVHTASVSLHIPGVLTRKNVWPRMTIRHFAAYLHNAMINLRLVYAMESAHAQRIMFGLALSYAVVAIEEHTLPLDQGIVFNVILKHTRITLGRWVATLVQHIHIVQKDLYFAHAHKAITLMSPLEVTTVNSVMNSVLSVMGQEEIVLNVFLIQVFIQSTILFLTLSAAVLKRMDTTFLQTLLPHRKNVKHAIHFVKPVMDPLKINAILALVLQEPILFLLTLVYVKIIFITIPVLETVKNAILSAGIASDPVRANAKIVISPCTLR
eukprot:TRINITY_DN21197_c0_g1_i4.p3 TRINITY_DN21197_c0_g1~~TRINITY_DN21197_c0_g1_i4.p3  ORF type:complete len:558 (+),score=-12.03 TRINITY_DN21197_c0_g1_i4:157-1830(+)